MNTITLSAVSKNRSFQIRNKSQMATETIIEVLFPKSILITNISQFGHSILKLCKIDIDL